MSISNSSDLLSTGLPPLLVSRNEARYYLGGICLKTLETLIKAGKLPTVKVRRRTMIPYHALVKLARIGAAAEK
jgi:hypothetical protein